jgi:hypothetical protein
MALLDLGAPESAPSDLPCEEFERTHKVGLRGWLRLIGFGVVIRIRDGICYRVVRDVCIVIEIIRLLDLLDWCDRT